jgi:hypothetical protein
VSLLGEMNSSNDPPKAWTEESRSVHKTFSRPVSIPSRQHILIEE